MQSFFSSIGISVVIAGILFVGALPFDIHAQTLDISAIIDALEKQIQTLQSQVEALRKQVNDPGTQQEVAPDDFSDVRSFTVSLWRGMSGNDVTNLQMFLSRLSGIYPEGLITGYFGPLTENAVKRFQARYAIEQVGIVGPKTRAQLNALLHSFQTPSPALPPSASTGDSSSASSSIPVPASDTDILSSPSSFALLPKPTYDITALALLIQDLVNEERAKKDVLPLTWDWSVAQVAFLHSADQARDNDELTNPDKNCQYPIIRHEGFTFGFSLKDRMLAQNIQFRTAGENIGILPLSKNLVYQYPQGNPPAECSIVEKFTPGEGTQEERTALYQSILRDSLNAVRVAEKVTWVRREWYTEEEVAARIVKGWMDSPGHRGNILESAFTFGGIGIAEVHDHLIITHNFVGR